MSESNSLSKAANVGHLAILKGYADEMFATKQELQQATGSEVESVGTATQMWNNYNIR